ncbi:MAG: 4Fe-4S dicluster domain-containing protein [Methylococcaceae bacterium]|nr:4Fe-4S dicluster domain-containing protein [Methylococcaceae bacterium]
MNFSLPPEVWDSIFENAVYGGGLGIILLIYFWHRWRSDRRSLEELKTNKEAGLMEPASLHPIFNDNRCIGCAACITACPEGTIIGLVDMKARLINPSHCIGHGACKTACPLDAITLVFGSETRGVDIPMVQPNFETNVPGIFIAGELGGMGLIRNAITQGRQALDSVRKLDGMGKGGEGLDVLIVGAGPAGFAASLGAMQHGLSYATLEQDSLGGTVFQFPRGKIVMTAPVDLPMVGKVNFKETTKEKLLEFWQDVEKKTQVQINYNERVETITPSGNGFLVKSNRQSYQTRSVLLAIGRRGTPRKLGVPGEDQPKVVYRLIDPAQYQNMHVLVVGGGDSAIEAATTIADEPGTTVTLSYRSEAFSRVKEKNRKNLKEREESGRVKVMLKSQVKRIDTDKVVIKWDEFDVDLPNDAVIICAGGILPTGFLKEIGVQVDTKFGTE